MKNIFAFFVLILLMISCSNQTKIPCYAWVGSDKNATDEELKTQFQDLKDKGIDGLMFHGGQCMTDGNILINRIASLFRGPEEQFQVHHVVDDHRALPNLLIKIPGANTAHLFIIAGN